MKTTARPRSLNAPDGARTAAQPTRRSRPRPLHPGDAATPVDVRRTDPGFDRWSPALTLGLALASPQTALLVVRLLGPRARRGLDA
jgi:hypothetical protein